VKQLSVFSLDIEMIHLA